MTTVLSGFELNYNGRKWKKKVRRARLLATKGQRKELRLLR